MGYALYLAQLGQKHESVKPLKGFSADSVFEIVDDYDGDAYRVVYAVKIADVVVVLHAFQKKSKKGIETPKLDIKLIRDRLTTAKQQFKRR